MAYTISVHNGSVSHRDHNIRNPKVVSKAEHIDADGEFEIWKDETLSHAYHRIFDESLREYNNKQTRSDREIKNYLAHVKNDAKKHPVYEMIVEVGCMINRPPEDIHKQILKEFFEGWDKRNPSLELIGAYFHNDEVGNTHIHMSYIPIGHNCTRGMSTQNSLVKALSEMGFEKIGKDTAQIQWQNSERACLESICKKYNLEIEHPTKEYRNHLRTEEYKLTKFIEELKDQTITLEKENQKLSQQNEDLSKDNNNLKESIAILKGERKKQNEIQIDKLGKNIFGNAKNKVELSYEDYQTLTKFNREYEDIEKTKTEIDRMLAKTKANYEKSELDKQEASILNRDAKQLINNQVNESIYKAFNGNSTDKMKRMEDFIKDIYLSNGNSVYEAFMSHEREIMRNINQRIR